MATAVNTSATRPCWARHPTSPPGKHAPNSTTDWPSRPGQPSATKDRTALPPGVKAVHGSWRRRSTFSSYAQITHRLRRRRSILNTHHHTRSSTGLNEPQGVRPPLRPPAIVAPTPCNMFRRRHHVQSTKVEQGSEKTGPAITEGKKGGQAGEEACRRYRSHHRTACLRHHGDCRPRRENRSGSGRSRACE